MGSTSAVFVAPSGHIWVADRCGVNSCANSNLAPVMEFDAAGKWNQCSTVRYGLGWEFGCARTWGTAKNAAALPISARTIWPEFGMTARLYSSV
jgi:hypothetical protein